MLKYFSTIFCVLFVGLGQANVNVPVVPYTSYDIKAKLNIWKHTLEGEQIVEYTNKTDQALDHIYFILPANLNRQKNPHLHDLTIDQGYWEGWESNSTTIRSVIDGKGNKLPFVLEKAPPIYQTYSLDKVLLKIVLPLVITPGEKQTLIIKFETRFVHNKVGDQSYWQEIYNWRFGWHPIERAFDKGKWDDDGIRFIPAKFKLTLTTPKAFEVVAGADIQKRLAETQTNQTHYFETTKPQLSIPLSMGPGLRKVSLKTDINQIDSYYRLKHRNAAQYMANLTDEIIKYYQPKFGKSRYQRIAIVENSLPLGAFSSDGVIYMAENLYRYKDLIIPGAIDPFVEYVLAHEIAHFWWGVAVSPDFAQENWLSEAFANYMAYNYIEEKYGRKNNMLKYDNPDLLMHIVKYLAGDLSIHQWSEYRYLDSVYRGWDEAIVKAPKDVQYGDMKSTRDYEKGYWVLRALENEYDRDVVQMLLRTIFEDYSGKQLTVEEFRKACEEILDDPLDWFFSQWLYADKASLDFRIQSVEAEATNHGFVSRIKIAKKGDAKATAMVLAETSNGELISRPISADKDLAAIGLDTDSPIVKVTVDPYQKLPDIYRLDNTWPRQVKTRFGYFDFPLDAYSIRYYALPAPVFLPSSGNTTFGLSFGVSGGYLPTHQWTVSSATGMQNDRFYLSNTAKIKYDFNASNSVFTEINSTGHDPQQPSQGIISLETGHQWTLYQAFDIGTTSRYLFDSNLIRNSLVYLDHEGWYNNARYQSYANEYDGPLGVWRFSYLRDDVAKYAMRNSLSWDFAPPGINHQSYYKLEYLLNKKFRLIPNWVLRIEASAGYASEHIPVPEQFELPMLRYNFGEHFARTSASFLTEVEFPIGRELEFRIANMIVMKGVNGNLFGQLAAVGGELVDADAVQAFETGAQLKFIFTSIAGAMDFSINAGLVMPWYEQNTGKELDFMSGFVGTGLQTVF